MAAPKPMMKAEVKRREDMALEDMAATARYHAGRLPTTSKWHGRPDRPRRAARTGPRVRGRGLRLAQRGAWRAASSSTSSAPRSAPSCSRPQAAISPARAAKRGVGEDPPRRPAQRAGTAEAPGEGEAGARPVEAHRGLAHVAGDRGDQDRGAGAERPRHGAVAAVGDDQRGDRHQLAVAQPVDEDGVGRDGDRALRVDPVGGRDDADRLVGERLQRGADQVVAGVVGGARRDQDERRVAGRQLDVGVGDLEGHRPGHLHPGAARRAGTRAAGRSRPGPARG